MHSPQGMLLCTDCSRIYFAYSIYLKLFYLPEPQQYFKNVYWVGKANSRPKAKEIIE